ncbi:polysaccharide deacetylase family protein [Natronolimnohabitans innermongolicus]|uniref:Polysaccharide deacetylase n=1 Tax=Natronolimnohabitans innermongolicus JCM 12255 TaxID=1227499 RepID=L9X2K4_9EURY|nr:polysaccharide deacetylase family protein [Natronolimnohabitans innermongolicus]ELY55842.1 polysaccharide deacetylase [Natronolimnohabitans innermongolicus JCM 12255]
MKRRAYLATATAAAAAFAGCSEMTGSSDDDENGGDNGDENGNGSSDPIDEEPGSFDEFEDLSKWHVEEGALEADGERYYTGSQSARMIAEEGDTRVMIKREFDSPRDLSTEFPSLAFASDTDLSVTLQLTDTDGDRLLLRTSVTADSGFVHRNFGLDRVEGEPDLSSIEHTKLSVYAGDRELSVWADDYQFVERPETGKVLLQFPDESVALDAASTVADYDVSATTFVTTDRVGAEGYPSVAALEDLDDDGWTIASKGASTSDLTQLSESEQEDQLTSAASWLADNGFENSVFSYPLNRYDETSIELVDEHYDVGFASGYAGHGYLSNAALAPRATNPEPDETDTLLRWAADTGTIATLSFRTLDDLEASLEIIDDLQSEGDLEVISSTDLAADYLN